MHSGSAIASGDGPPSTPKLEVRGAQDRAGAGGQPSYASKRRRSQPPKRPLKRPRSTTGKLLGGEESIGNDGFDPEDSGGETSSDEAPSQRKHSSRTTKQSSSEDNKNAMGSTVVDSLSEEDEFDEENENGFAQYPTSVRTSLHGRFNKEGLASVPAAKRARTSAQAGKGKGKTQGRGKGKGKSKRSDSPSVVGAAHTKSRASGGSPSKAGRRSASASKQVLPWRGVTRALLCAGLAPVTDPVLILVRAQAAALVASASAPEDQDGSADEGAAATPSETMPSRRSAPVASQRNLAR